MSNYKNNLGQWFKEEIKEGESTFRMINVIEIDDVNGVARAIGENIPLSELGTVYHRKEKISGDPFAALGDGAFVGLDAEIISEIPTANHSVGEVLDRPVRQIKQETASYVEDPSFSPGHQLIRNAIKLSNAVSDIDFEIEHQFPFDIRKIKTVAESLDISAETVAEVIMSSLRQNPEVFFGAIEKSLVKILSEKDIMQG